MNDNDGDIISLIGRRRGIELAKKHIDDMETMLEYEKVICDFKGIQNMTVSFLDGFYECLREKIKRNNVIELNNVQGELLEEIEAFFSFRKTKYGESLAFVFRDKQEYRLIGNVDAASLATFEYLKDGKEITPRYLADQEGIEINAASNRLARLFQKGVVFRKEIINSEGKMFYYFLK